jgi:beta-mannosidase
MSHLQRLFPQCVYPIIAVLLITFGPQAIAQRKSFSLNDHWEFRQRAEDANAAQSPWHPATVPGVVHTDLLNNKLIPDPFYRSNEGTLQWIENASWEYRSTFQVTPETLKRSHVELVFEGIDGPARVFLNDKLILTATNMFREWRIDVKGQLTAGANQLRVEFPSPIEEGRKVAAKDIWQTQVKAEPESYLRKAAYEYGWDWGPSFVTS